MNYRHTFRVRAPLTTVADFHRRSASMPAITPPPAVVRVHRAPAQLGEGDEMDFTLWLGPIPVRWLARIEETGSAGFVDRQVRGPFRDWAHRHTFTAVDETTTEIHDEVRAALPFHLWRTPIALGMWLSLPLLFAYRAWKTRRLLERG